jgi:protease-4
LKSSIKEFALQVVAAGIGWIGSVAVIGLAVGIGAYAWTYEEEVEGPEKVILTINLGVPITDRGLEPSLEASVRAGGAVDSPLALRKVLDALEHAAEDDKIAGVYLHGGVDGGWANLKEIRDAIGTIRAADKQIYAYYPYYSEGEYYIASQATKIFMPRFSEVSLDGLAAEVMYFAGMFEKVGVEVQVTRVGKYKSAVEPLILEEMSEPNREQLENYLGDIFDVFATEAAAGRGMEVAAFRALIEANPMMPTDKAIELGLADQMAYLDEVYAELTELAGEDEDEETFHQVALADYIDSYDDDEEADDEAADDEAADDEAADDEAADDEDETPSIAVIYAEGSIVDGSGNTEVSGDTVARAIRKARVDEHVKALVLRVNSPGGSVSASEVILREMRLTADAKPVVVSMGNYAASGGYWISAYAHEIVAQPNTITGSIGVFGLLPNASGLMEKAGIKVHTVKTGQYADIGSVFRSKSDDELALIQESVDEIYDAFLERVSEGRSMDRAKVAEIAQGRVWSGKDALELGLVDKLGNLDDALAAAEVRAGLEGVDYEIDWPGKESNKYMEVVEELLADDDESPILAGIPVSLLNAAHELALLNDPRGVYVRMPFLLEVR